jgi:phage gp46-like protein
MPDGENTMTTCKSCQGDPAIKITLDGAIMQFIGGQPIMDSGLENAVQISLFTKKGWFGNAFLKKANQQIGSDFEKRSYGPINIDSINNIEDAADNALKWFSDSKITKQIDVIVANPKADYIKTDIQIQPNAGDAIQLSFLQHGQNWINQSQNPAHARFTEA